MIKTLIAGLPTERRTAPDDGSPIMDVAECFYDTIQGENFSGYPATFLRVQGCTLSCSWCDSLETWKVGNPYSTKELAQMFADNGLLDRFQKGQHLIYTGGSPVKQQDAFLDLMRRCMRDYGVKPFVEIENECTRMPSDALIAMVSRWNNSPKTLNSGMKREVRYKPEILKVLSGLPDSWFKFVISSEMDWCEIEDDFLKPELITREQIVLMPEGSTRYELQQSYDSVINLAVREGVRMTDRLQVTVWEKTTGV